MKAVHSFRTDQVEQKDVEPSPVIGRKVIEAPSGPESSKTSQKWIIRISALLLVILIGAVVFWYYQRPTTVSVVKARPAVITEIITSSGRVGGITEANVGAQTQGIVQELYVDEGIAVVAGQKLALIKNDVAVAQIQQAQATVNTARSQLEVASRGSLSSDIDASRQQVAQAQAQAEQQNAAIAQARSNVAQANSLLAQFEAESALAKTNHARNARLIEDGIIPRSEFDQSRTALLVAEKKVAAQKQAVELAQSGVRSAQAGLTSAQANVAVQQARLRTLQSGARPEDIAVARRRVAEADQALRVALEQSANAVVSAPFAGTVTKINTQAGQAVGAMGVLTLVSDQLEIRVDVDESNLSALRVGQVAVISSGTFKASEFRGTVTELSAAVDETRGTIEISVVPIKSPEWLRPGQTVDVNIITAENVDRLLVPQTAVVRSGEETVVLIIVNGKVAQKPVVTRPVTKEGVPIFSGLEPGDLIIANASAVEIGQKVRAK